MRDLSQEQAASFDIQSVQYENERQKLQVEIQKKDKNSRKPLEGAVFGLYAAEDIYTNILYDMKNKQWIIRDQPEISVIKGTFIKACVTGKDGKGTFSDEIPLGKYEIRELMPPSGYVLTDETKSVDASYGSANGGQFVSVQKYVETFYNEKTDEPKQPHKPHSPKQPPIEENPVVPQPAPVESPTTGDSAPLCLLGFAGILALLGLGMIGSVERRRRR